MFLLALIHHSRVNPYSIVAYTQYQVVCIGELDSKVGGSRVNARVADRLIPDAVDLIANDGVHLADLASHGKGGFDGAVDSTLFNCPLESCRKIVLLCGRGAQRAQGCPALFRRTSQPDR